ncbi:MAG TPA: hypothetical protein VGC26_12105 [Afipia sp.]
MTFSSETLRWLATILISFIGGTATATWYISDIDHRLKVTEGQVSVLNKNQIVLYNAISADPALAPPKSFIKNAGEGAVCDPGYAVNKISLSTVNDQGTVVCTRFKPQVSGFVPMP